jgi:hypothetical protein
MTARGKEFQHLEFSLQLATMKYVFMQQVVSAQAEPQMVSQASSTSV